jgi:hypothetical protein
VIINSDSKAVPAVKEPPVIRPKTESAETACLLPLPMPTDSMQRITLFALRRMASQGIRDAYAANLFFNRFGLHFRRPLVLMRAFMVELAQTSQRTITIAPCCALRMTADEGRIVGVLATAASNPANAAKYLCELADSRSVSQPLSAAAAFNDALADLGQPLVI